MTSIVLSTPGAGTWTVPLDCLVGTSVTAEAWGAGSGGSGTGATNGGGGAGGAYASTPYIITPNDVTNGVSYAVGTGGAGNTGVGSIGGNTSWSANNANLVPNSVMAGAVVGSPGTIPGIANGVANTGWSIAQTGLVQTVVGFGTINGLRYIDLNYAGTATAINLVIYTGFFPIAASTTYIGSGYLQLVGGSNAGITNVYMYYNTYTGPLSAPVYAATLGTTIVNATLPSTLTQYHLTATSSGTTGPPTIGAFLIQVSYPTGAMNFTIRIAGVQFEAASSVTAWKSSPGYTLAAGGAAPIGTAGGVGGTVAASVGATLFAGGSGATYNAAGSGGGGSGGKNGAGNVGTTAGHGGQGDSATGGTGGAVKTTTPGNPGTSNVEGGGGGGALTSVAGVGGAGGVPGGGGGGSDYTSGTRTGGTAGDGQIRLTYTPFIYHSIAQLAPILAQ